MNLAQLQQEVYALTNRPDLVPETLSAIKAATLKCHHSDFFYKDLQTAQLTLATADFTNQFDTAALLRYRAMSYIRKWYPTGVSVQTLLPTGKPGSFLTPISTDEVLDSYQRDRNNVYYIAGTTVQLKTHDQLATFLCSWYAHPSIDIANFQSFIAVEHPYAVVYEAAGAVFKMIGYDEQSTRYSALSAEQLQMLKMSNIEVQAR